MYYFITYNLLQLASNEVKYLSVSETIIHHHYYTNTIRQVITSPWCNLRI